MTTLQQFRQQFLEYGFAGPVPLLTKQQCEETLSPQNTGIRPPLWSKALAVSNPHLYRVAKSQQILQFLTELFGENILLWGSRLVHKGPGVEHPWHSDIECLDESGQAVTVWIGLDKTSHGSSLQVITRSHLFPESLQEVAFKSGKKRQEVSTEEVLRWAQERDPRSRLVQFDANDGDAFFLHRKLWHYSKNITGERRTALLLQYCTPDSKIRMPCSKEYEWPFHYSEQRPPCILVQGADDSGTNRIVDPPSDELPPHCVLQTIDALQFKWRNNGWRSGSIFKSAQIDRTLTSHVSILQEGATPHEPHTHADEELLILLSGVVDIIRVAPDGTRTAERLKQGNFVYHSAFQSHTLTSVGPGPATYLMFKWKGNSRSGEETILPSGTFNMQSGTRKYRDGWRRIVQLQSPTRYLKKLNAHLSILSPGKGYEPHRDSYDVAILTLSGKVETLGHEISAQSVVLYPADELHGMKNVGQEKAEYMVFEFHWE